MSHTQDERTIVFLSELEHIGLCEDFLKKNPSLKEEGFLIVPLDLEIEYVLKEKGIPFRSGGTYRTEDASAMTLAEEWTASIFESKQWSFFTYRGVSLSRLYFLPLQWYLSHVIYYTDIVANVMRTHIGVQKLVAFSRQDTGTVMGSTLVGPQARVFVDVIKCIALQKGVELTIVSIPAQSAMQRQSVLFMRKRALFGIGIGVLNACITLLRRPQRIRALASDYWKNLEPYVSALDSLEIVLVDRKEAFNAGLSNIWKYRMRFLHLDAFSIYTAPERATETSRIREEWHSLKGGAELPAYEFRGVSVRSIVISALDRIVNEVLTKTLKDIDDARTMLTRLKPDIVLLRATMSTQTHFVILAQVAHAQGVPSLEVQHGLEYLGPGSYTRRHSAEYMGVYGSFTEQEMNTVGGSFSKPIRIGSPRFDAYALLQKEASVTSAKAGGIISFLCIAPAIDPGGDLDTYDYTDYFSAIALALKKVPNARAVIKFRGPNRDSFTRRTIASLFAGIPYTIVQTEPLVELFPDADVVISCFSTVTIEAMQSGKPLVYLGLSPAQKLMGLHHFSPYAEADAIRLATDKEGLSHIVEELGLNLSARAKLAKQGVAFLKQNYAFDGHASERTAQLVRSLAARGSR